MIALFLADGFEEIEAVTVLDILRRVQLDVTLISIHPHLNVVGAHGLQVTTDALFTDWVQTDPKPEMIVLPGGMPGSQHLADHKALGEFLKALPPTTYLSAICAAPMVLGGLKLLEGKQATCYPGFEDTLLGATPIQAPVVQDGNVITANGPGAAMAFAFSLVSILKGKIQAQGLAKAMQTTFE